MKSDKKDGARTVGRTAESDRREREAAALRANLRRRKQQQQAREVRNQAEKSSPDKPEA